MTLFFWETVSTLLLVLPSLYTCWRLWRARSAEREATKAGDTPDGQFKSADAIRLAGAASLFKFPVLASFTAGLLIQLLILLYKIFLLPA